MPESLVLPDWARLLDSRDQPRGVERAYELVGEFVHALADPCPLDARDLYPAAAARAGYLIAVAGRLAGGRIDGSWEMLREHLRARERHATDVELLVAQPGADPYDELATVWGLRRGLDPEQLRKLGASDAA